MRCRCRGPRCECLQRGRSRWTCRASRDADSAEDRRVDGLRYRDGGDLDRKGRRERLEVDLDVSEESADCLAE